MSTEPEAPYPSNQHEYQSCVASRQAFESEIFGATVWRLQVRSAAPTPADLCALVAAARQQDVALIACRLPTGCSSGLADAGFYNVETLLTLCRDVPRIAAMPVGVELGNITDAPAASAIARTCFAHDRYHSDRAVPPSVADEIKARWVSNGFSGRADAALVAHHDGALAGFNLCMRHGDDAVIDLIGVSAQARGRGYGRKLMQAALAHYAGRAGRMLVGTQATNEPSLALYRSQGFVPHLIEETWHWMPRKA